MYKCIIEAPDGAVFIGRGAVVEEAYKQALKTIELANLPKKGPGMWEPAKVEEFKHKNDI